MLNVSVRLILDKNSIKSVSFVLYLYVKTNVAFLQNVTISPIKLNVYVEGCVEVKTNTTPRGSSGSLNNYVSLSVLSLFNNTTSNVK